MGLRQEQARNRPGSARFLLSPSLMRFHYRVHPSPLLRPQKWRLPSGSRRWEFPGNAQNQAIFPRTFRSSIGKRRDSPGLRSDVGPRCGRKGLPGFSIHAGGFHRHIHPAGVVFLPDHRYSQVLTPRMPSCVRPLPKAHTLNNLVFPDQLPSPDWLPGSTTRLPASLMRAKPGGGIGGSAGGHPEVHRQAAPACPGMAAAWWQLLVGRGRRGTRQLRLPPEASCLSPLRARRGRWTNFPPRNRHLGTPRSGGTESHDYAERHLESDETHVVDHEYARALRRARGR